jgi:hypothetical protein
MLEIDNPDDFSTPVLKDRAGFAVLEMEVLEFTGYGLYGTSTIVSQAGAGSGQS